MAQRPMGTPKTKSYSPNLPDITLGVDQVLEKDGELLPLMVVVDVMRHLTNQVLTELTRWDYFGGKIY